jgi:CheY-like chemotaxis protein
MGVMRVLVAAAHVVLADRIAEGLRDPGLAADVGNDGSAALTQAGRTADDVLVLDQDLPVARGDQVCRRPAGGCARILLLTAAAGVDERLREPASQGGSDGIARRQRRGGAGRVRPRQGKALLRAPAGAGARRAGASGRLLPLRRWDAALHLSLAGQRRQVAGDAGGLVRDDLDQTMDELASRGVVFEQYDQPGLKTNERGGFDAGRFRAAWIKDPDGNTMALTEVSG